LGDLAIRYGYQRFRADVLLVSVIVILVMVEACQVVGDYLVARLMAKR
jgi:D-methionine transport system permease protein